MNIEDYKPGMIVYGKVSGIKPYGAFLEFENGVTGLIHISEISSRFVSNISYFLNLDEFVTCKVIDVDRKNKQLRLSYKVLRENNRKTTNKLKYGHMPENKIGFNSLKEKMPEWLS